MRLVVFIAVMLSASTAFSIEGRRKLSSEVPFEMVKVKESAIFFKKVKVAFFDADSTIRVSKSGSVSANSIDDVAVLPCVAPRIAELNKAGYIVVIVSNQGGVSFGAVTDEVAASGIRTAMRLLKDRNSGAVFHYFDYAGYKNKFRKEKTGMAYLLAEKLRRKLHVDDVNYGGMIIDKKLSFMVGDSLYKPTDIKPNGESGVQFSNSDRCFAENYFIRYFDPSHFFGWRDFPQPIKMFDPAMGMEQIASAPADSKAGGAVEQNYCKQLIGYRVYSSALANKEPTDQWIADYQIREDGGILSPPLFQRKGCKSQTQ